MHQFQMHTHLVLSTPIEHYHQVPTYTAPAPTYTQTYTPSYSAPVSAPVYHAPAPGKIFGTNLAQNFALIYL